MTSLSHDHRVRSTEELFYVFKFNIRDSFEDGTEAILFKYDVQHYIFQITSVSYSREDVDRHPLDLSQPTAIYQRMCRGWCQRWNFRTLY